MKFERNILGLALVVVGMFPANSHARLFRRSSGFHSFGRLTHTQTFSRPRQSNAAMTFMETIGGKKYLVEYSMGEGGVPVARVTHFMQGDFAHQMTEERDIPRTSKVLHTMPDGRRYAFVFERTSGKAYAALEKPSNAKPYWRMLRGQVPQPQNAEELPVPPARQQEELPSPPARPAPSHQPEELPAPPTSSRPGSGDRSLLKPASGPSAEEKSLLDRANRLEHQLDVRSNDPRVQRVMRYGGPAYSRFLHAYGSRMNTRLPSREELANRSGFKKTPRGTYSVALPKDPNRPGVIITSDDPNFQAVDDVVTELRNATTSAIISRAAFRRNRDQLLRAMRANSFIVAKAGSTFSDGLQKAQSRLDQLPQQAAARAVIQAERQTGHGIFRSASTRVNRAAAGGFGRRRFNQGLAQGYHQALSQAGDARNQVSQIVVDRAKEIALREKRRADERGAEVGKAAHLMGFEVDFLNKRQIGIDYTVTTKEGKTYVLRNVGKNFQDSNGVYMPAVIYGRFNYTILEHYMKGLLTKEKFYEIAMAYDLYPTEDGSVVYAGPERYTAARLEQIRAGLKARYQQKGALTRQDILDI